jgi:hypothetical protein
MDRQTDRQTDGQIVIFYYNRTYDKLKGFAMTTILALHTMWISDWEKERGIHSNYMGGSGICWIKTLCKLKVKMDLYIFALATTYHKNREIESLRRE